MSPNPIKNLDKNKKIFLILLVIFIILKTLIASTSLDFYEYDHEGVLTRDMIKGQVNMSIFTYEEHCYGLTPLTAAILVPFYLLFGSYGIVSIFRMLMFSLVLAVIFYYLLRRFFNEKIALISLILFIFSPVFFILETVKNGALIFSAIFDLLILYYGFKILFLNHKEIDYYIFGIVSGFFIFLWPSSIIAFLAFLVFSFAYKKLIYLKNLLKIIFSSLIGFSLYLFSCLGSNTYAAHFSMLSILKTPFLIKEKLFSLLIEYLPNSFSFNGYLINSMVLNYLYYAIFLFAFVFLIGVYRKSILNFINGLFIPKLKKINISIFLIIYIFVFIFVFVFSDRTIISMDYLKTYRHVFYLYMPIFMVLSIFFYRLIFKKKTFKFTKILGIVLLSIFVIIGFFSNIALMNFKNNNFSKHSIYKAFPYPGYSYNEFIFDSYSEKNLSSNLLLCDSLPEQYRLICFYNLLEDTADFDEHSLLFLYDECIKEDITNDPLCFILYGQYSVVRNNCNEAFDYCNNLSISLQEKCYQGLAWGCGFNSYYYTENIGNCNRYDETQDKDLKDNCLFGLAETVARNFKFDPKSGVKICDDLFDGQHENYCTYRLAYYTGINFNYNPKKGHGFCGIFNDENKRLCYIALGSSIAEIHFDDIDHLFEVCEDTFSEMKYCEYGINWFINWRYRYEPDELRNKCNELNIQDSLCKEIDNKLLLLPDTFDIYRT